MRRQLPLAPSGPGQCLSLGNREAPGGLEPPGASSFAEPGGLNFLRSIVTFPRWCRLQFARRGCWGSAGCFGGGRSMETKVSYGARFFTKFVEIIAAGLATAVSAYLIAQLGGLLNSVAPAPAVVQTVATVGDGGKSPARTVAPIAASAIDDQHAGLQPEADASAVPAARKASRPGHDVPARKD